MLLLTLWVCLTPSWALTPGNPPCGPKNRTWDFFAKSAPSRPETAAASHEPASGKPVYGYENRIGPNCCCEQWDADLGLYYNRARYLNTDSGRFWTMDGYEGKNEDPMSIHKYLYASCSPIDCWDPSGQFTLGEMMETVYEIGVWAKSNCMRMQIAVKGLSRIGFNMMRDFFRNEFSKNTIRNSLFDEAKKLGITNDTAEMARFIQSNTSWWNRYFDPIAYLQCIWRFAAGGDIRGLKNWFTPSPVTGTVAVGTVVIAVVIYYHWDEISLWLQDNVWGNGGDTARANETLDMLDEIRSNVL